MRAMLLETPGSGRLVERDVRTPEPAGGQVRIRVSACGVCRTDLHVVDGDLSEPVLPLAPGHEIVGRVDLLGPGVTRYAVGDRVGVPWLGGSCGQCRYCGSGRENLCAEARYTGYRLDGGYAEYAVADERFAFPIPEGIDDVHAAPLLCAGLIGYRAYRMAVESGIDVHRVGLYGFGAAAHIVAQVAIHHGREVFAFTRPGDDASQAFARELGAVWAGPSDRRPDVPLDAAILFAPAGELVPEALRAVGRAGVVVCAGIHMSDIPSFPYRILWEERVLRSVANLTRQDAVEFLALAPTIPIKTHVTTYPLTDAGQALDDLRHGRFQGAAVLVP